MNYSQDFNNDTAERTLLDCVMENSAADKALNIKPAPAGAYTDHIFAHSCRPCLYGDCQNFAVWGEEYCKEHRTNRHIVSDLCDPINANITAAQLEELVSLLKRVQAYDTSYWFMSQDRFERGAQIMRDIESTLAAIKA